MAIKTFDTNCSWNFDTFVAFFHRPIRTKFGLNISNWRKIGVLLLLENDLNFMKKIEYLLYDKVCVKQRRDFNNYNGKYVDNTCCSDHKSLILLFFHFWMSNWICSFGFGLHSRKIIKRGEAEYFGQKWIVFFPLFKTEIIYILLAWTDFFFSIAFPFFSFHLAFEIRSFSFLFQFFFVSFP